MQTLGLDSDNNSAETREKFWARQFQEVPTDCQKKFDWAFGVVLPVVCFFFDPIIFKGQLWGLAVFAGYKPFAYLMGFVSVMSMVAWLLWRERVKWLGAPFAGIFFVGGLVSLCVGIMIFPLSLLGLIFIVGALGFTPLITGVIYLRNALRTMIAARSTMQTSVIVYSVALAAIFATIVPFVINAEIAKSLEGVTRGDHGETFKLRLAAPLVNFDQLALYYHRSSKDERSTEKMQRIAALYAEMTGEDIETRVSVLMD